jgi:8-oxo-dGTP diphosphatase
MEFEDWEGREYEIPDDREISWRPSVYALIIEEEEVLLVKPKWHDMWELPGGGVEIDENFGSALKREVLEETGYEVCAKDGGPIHLEENFFYAPNIDEYFHTIPMVFSTSIRDEEQKRDEINFEDEIDEIKWFSLEEIESIKMHSITISALEKR